LRISIFCAAPVAHLLAKRAEGKRVETMPRPATGAGQEPDEAFRHPLAVVIVTYNSADVLPGLLDTLEEGLAGAGPSRVMVVDNDSADDSVAIARRHPFRPEVIETGHNGGYAAGINVAAAAAGADADLLILNPDIRLRPGVARALRSRLAHPALGAVAPRVSHDDGTLALSIRREPSLMTVWSESLLGGRLSTRLGIGEIVADPGIYARGGKVDWATGAALMISAAARRRIGDWDESFFLYSEEVDYLRRIRKGGMDVEYVPEAQVMHIGGEYSANPFLSGLMARNRIRDYARRHGMAATAIFRLGVIAGETLRLWRGPAHRAALWAACLTVTLIEPIE
jgi:GT2 family glycosyltransferase